MTRHLHREGAADQFQSDARRFRATLEVMSDEELMEQFQTGCVEAFNIIVDRFSDRLMQYLRGFLKDETRCQDMLQETFMRVYRNRHSYTRIARLSTWIYTIAGNLARSDYRRRQRWKMSSITAQTRDGEEEFEKQLMGDILSPDEYAESVIQDKHIQNALMQIPVTFREVIVLRDIQDMDYESIARITALPLGTVKSRINRGRIKLQELLRDIYPYDNLSTV